MISKGLAQELTDIAIARRPLGAPKWEPAGVMAAIGRIKTWPLATLIDEVLAHAADATAKTPGAIGKGFTPTREPVQRTSRNPSTAEACSVCGGFKDTCGHPQGNIRVADPEFRAVKLAEIREALRR